MQWVVYFLECSKDGSIYIGTTNNISKRIEKHNAGRGAKYTRNRLPVKLLKTIPCLNKSQALKLEYQLKQLTRQEKLNLINQKEPMTKDNFTSINIVLDASGSMTNLQTDTIGSFNTFLAEQKAVKGEAVFTLAVFNHEYKLIHDFAKLDSVPNLDAKSYNPNGYTALLDALGTTMDNVGSKLAAMPEHERPSKVVWLIITDGKENSSTQYTASRIKEMVQHQTDKYQWLFVFTGANIDAITAGKDMGVSVQNSLNYVASSAGIKTLYQSVSSNMSILRSASCTLDARKTNFFDLDQQDQDNKDNTPNNNN
jgi:predicted GIY-YIG superfamily endonuclease